MRHRLSIRVRPAKSSWYDTLGLYLEISPAGGKWFRFKYRFDGKEKLLSLGTYPDTSLADARERRDAAALLVLTAVRPGELRGALWSEFDTDRALWRIGGERMKMKTEHLVPLSRQALAVLARMKDLSGSDVLVFPSPFYPGKPLSENTLNSALARMGYKGAATAHGMRTLFSTIANEHGFVPDVIEKQLAHEERDDVRGAYNRAMYLAERTKLMQWYADYLDKLRDGAEVIPFKAE